MIRSGVLIYHFFIFSFCLQPAGFPDSCLCSVWYVIEKCSLSLCCFFSQMYSVFLWCDSSTVFWLLGSSFHHPFFIKPSQSLVFAVTRSGQLFFLIWHVLKRPCFIYLFLSELNQRRMEKHLDFFSNCHFIFHFPKWPLYSIVIILEETKLFSIILDCFRFYYFRLY